MQRTCWSPSGIGGPWKADSAISGGKGDFGLRLFVAIVIAFPPLHTAVESISLLTARVEDVVDRHPERHLDRDATNTAWFPALPLHGLDCRARERRVHI
jgi:hypothetical protein